jgi:hypothetical protein
MFKNILNFKGLSFWLLGSAIGLNVVWVALMMIFTVIATPKTETPEAPEWLGLVLIVAAFLGPFLIALLIGKMASDQRGPTYGLMGALIAALIVAALILPGNVEIGFIMLAVTLLGGLNGGLMSQRRGESN